MVFGRTTTAMHGNEYTPPLLLVRGLLALFKPRCSDYLDYNITTLLKARNAGLALRDRQAAGRGRREDTGIPLPTTCGWSIDQEQDKTRGCQGREVQGGAFKKGKWGVSSVQSDKKSDRRETTTVR